MGDRGRVLDELLALCRLLGEIGEEAVERGGDGVEAGDEEQEADVEDLLARQTLAVVLGNLVAAIPGRMAARTPAALLLRTE